MMVVWPPAIEFGPKGGRESAGISGRDLCLRENHTLDALTRQAWIEKGVRDHG